MPEALGSIEPFQIQSAGNGIWRPLVERENVGQIPEIEELLSIVFGCGLDGFVEDLSCRKDFSIGAGGIPLIRRISSLFGQLRDKAQALTHSIKENAGEPGIQDFIVARYV